MLTCLFTLQEIARKLHEEEEARRKNLQSAHERDLVCMIGEGLVVMVVHNLLLVLGNGSESAPGGEGS